MPEKLKMDECPECGCADVVQKADEVSSIERISKNGDCAEVFPTGYCELVGNVICECSECDNSWVVPTGLEVVKHDIFDKELKAIFKYMKLGEYSLATRGLEGLLQTFNVSTDI